MDFIEVTVDARSDFHRLRRLETANVVVHSITSRADWLDDRNRRAAEAAFDACLPHPSPPNPIKPAAILAVEFFHRELEVS